jgi:hypothetical protein
LALRNSQFTGSFQLQVCWVKIANFAPSLSGIEKGSNAGFLSVIPNLSGEKSTQKPALEPFSFVLSDGAIFAICTRKSPNCRQKQITIHSCIYLGQHDKLFEILEVK